MAAGLDNVDNPVLLFSVIEFGLIDPAQFPVRLCPNPKADRAANNDAIPVSHFRL